MGSGLRLDIKDDPYQKGADGDQSKGASVQLGCKS